MRRRVSSRSLLVYWTAGFALLLCAWQRPVQAQSALVLIDGSGSMSGFAATGELWRLADNLCVDVKAQGVGCRQEVFVSRQGDGSDLALFDIKDFKKTPQWGSKTHLYEAFQAGKGETLLIFLLTDNVYSGASADLLSGTERFYDAFKGAERALFAPVVARFKGRAYVPLLGRTREQAHAELKEAGHSVRLRDLRVSGDPPEVSMPYAGDRGLALYAAALGPVAAERLQELKPHLDFDFVLVKPVTYHEIHVRAVEDQSDIIRKVTEWYDRCRGEEPKEIYAANFTFSERSEKGFLLRPIAESGFKPELDEVINVVFYFSLVSRLEHLDISSPDAEWQDLPEGQFPCSGGIKLRVVDEELVKLAPDNGSLAAEADGQIIPPNLVGVLRSGEKNQFVYYSHVRFGPLETRFWKLLTAPAVSIRFHFNVEMEIPRQGFSFNQSYREKYFSWNPNDLRRIYSSKDLIQHLADETVLVEIPFTSP